MVCLVVGLNADVSGVNYSIEMGCFHKDLPSIKNAYVTPKKFTTDHQIFYTFPVFWLNVQVFVSKNTPIEKGRSHKALSNVKNAYVTLREFTPD